MLRSMISAVAVSVVLAFPAMAQETGVEEELEMFSTAVDSLHEKANAGNSTAAFYLSSFYHVGMFVQPDRQRAMDYLRTAAEAEHPEGQYYLGLKLINGHDMERDIERGTELIRAAADSGHHAAQIAVDLHLGE
jgi:TPR repeat protein